MNQRYLYLHGFASSPQSAKAQYLRDRFAEISIDLPIPDLNLGDFGHLTFTRQLQQVEAIINSASTPVVLIGSSFGGLASTWLAQRNRAVQQLVVLAPAFQFLSHWLPRVEESQMRQWLTEGYMPVYHYGEKRQIPLHYQFLLDMQQYRDEELQRNIPTLILHGRGDDVIPIQASRDFAATRTWVKLIELDGDHSLGTALPEIWPEIKEKILRY